MDAGTYAEYHATGADKGEASRPNIVFLLADDLGYNDVQYNGGVALTPNLNELASGENSVRFDRFYSSAPVCSPTRGSLLTGRNHNRFCLWMANTAGRRCEDPSDFHCSTKYPLPPSEVTVAELLRGNGYRTAAFGKWHLGDLVPGLDGHGTSHPGQHGFQTWKVTERAVPTSNPNCACFDKSLCNLGHDHRKGPPPCTNYHGMGNGNATLMSYPEIILKDDSEFIVDEFSKFLDEVLVGKDPPPFFAYLPFHSVHKRFVATPPYDTLYDAGEFSLEEVDYYASISAMDAAVGRVRDLLRQHEVSDNTMLWFSSDNGPAENCPGSTEGLRGRKGSLYEGGIKVPGIVEWPNFITENHVSKYPVSSSDFVPTILDIVGLLGHPTTQLDGDSVLPLLLSRTADAVEKMGRNSSMKWAFNIRGDFNGRYSAVIMENNHKLIAQYKRGLLHSYELFDLNRDPAETHDLSQLEASVSTRLLAALGEWLVSVQNSATTEVGCYS